MNKKITIVIVTYNARHYIEECLESVFIQNYPKDLVKIIIIDNNSNDSTVGFIKDKYPQVKLIENRQNIGFAAANNQGHYLAKKQGSDYLVLLNQDTIVDANWLSRLIKTAESDRNIAIIQPKLLLHPDVNRINSFGNSIHFLGFAYCNKYKEKNNQDITDCFEIPYSSGAACLIRMSCLEEMELFQDKLFMYHEDVDLGWRLRLAGYKIILNPQVIVYHKYNYSKAKYKFYHMDRNRLVVTLENYRIPTLLLLLPAFLVMELGILLFSIKNGWFKEKIRGYGWVLFHWPTLLSQRLDVQFRIRKVKDKEILELFTGSIKFQEIDNWLLTKIVNPVMEVYLWLVKKVIFW